MTEPNLDVMFQRYKFNREKETKYREIAETYETQIMKVLISKFKEMA